MIDRAARRNPPGVHGAAGPRPAQRPRRRAIVDGLGLLLALAAGAGCSRDAGPPAAVVPLEWRTDFERAKQEAAVLGRPILADFTGSDWCSWCIKLKREVFDTAAFAAWASENVVLLEVDFPQRSELPPALEKQNHQLAQRYGVNGYPTIVFLDAGGEVLARYGYDEGGPEAWISVAESKLRGR